MKVFLIGIDVGTSSTKAMVVSPEGRTVCIAQERYGIVSRRANWAEQDPEIWWQAVKTALRHAIAKTRQQFAGERIEFAAIGLSGQMHGLVLLDAQGCVLRPSIIWADQRTTQEAAAFYQAAGRDRIAGITANAVVPGFLGPSLLWVKAQEPDIYQQIRSVLLPKDYIRFRLTGTIGTDPTDASGTALYDVFHRTWSEELCRLVGIPSSLLPECYDSTEIAGCLQKEVAEELGLAAGIPVAFGASDQTMQALGNGAIRPGMATINIGTAGQVYMPLNQPLYDRKLRINTCCNVGRSQWYVMGGPLAAGLSLSWCLDLFQDMDFAQVDAVASDVPAGSDGLLYLPYLIGERAPHLDPLARGALIGLTLGHKKASIIRAVMEGVAFALLDSMEVMKEIGVSARHIIASGGGSGSAVWRQILADVFNCPILLTGETEQACLGAAVTAAAAVKLYSSLAQACEHMTPRAVQSETPIPERVSQYRRLFPLYQAAYQVNKDIFHALNAQEEVTI